MPRSSPSCHQVRRSSPSPPLPRPPVAAPHPSAVAGPQHLPSPHPGSIASGQRHSPGSRNSPGPGQRLTHWRTLMKPNGSSSRRQRSPTSRRSTCGDTASRGIRAVGSPGKALVPLPHSHAVHGWDKGPARHLGGEGRVRESEARRDYLLARRLVRRAAGALGRGHAGAAGAGRGGRGARRGGLAPWPAGCGHCVGAGSCRSGAEQASGAGARAAVGGPESWLGRRGAAVRALRGCGRRGAPPAAESPRVGFKLLSNSQRTWPPSHVAYAPEPSSRPLCSLSPLAGHLKGTCGLRG